MTRLERPLPGGDTDPPKDDLDDLLEEVPSAPASAQRPEPPPDPYIGALVAGRYRILRKLGEGGMGAVYLAQHEVIERKVAIKILAQDFARKADLVQRFIQEARAAARIGHENIVEVYDFGETDSGSVFFAMEYLEGQDLAQIIRAQAPLPLPRVKNITEQICKALGAAHGKQIIHRDLKPENVFLVDKEGRGDFVKVLDFGIAKISNMEEDKGRLTRTGMIFGTPEYMSPEQARGDAPDHRVDVYALGCIIYEMLTGTVPFAADTFMGVLTKQMFEPVEPPSRRAPLAVSREIEEVCLRALEKDRDRRFQSMQQLAQALDGELPPLPPGGQVVAPVLSGNSSRSQRVGGAPGEAQRPPLATTGPLPAMMPPPPPPGSPPAGAQVAYPLPAPLPGPMNIAASYMSRGQDLTAQSPLPAVHGRRRLWAILAGAGVGLAALSVLLLRNQLPPTAVSGGSGVTEQVEPHLVSPVRTVPPVIEERRPEGTQETAPGEARPAKVGPAIVLITGTAGAMAEVGGRRGLIPPREKGPLRLEVELAELAGFQGPGREQPAQLVVRKKDFVEETRELVLAPGKEVAQDVNLKRRVAKEAPARPAPPPEEAPQRPPQQPPPPDKGLRNPFLKMPAEGATDKKR